MDEQQETQDERREDTSDMDWITTAKVDIEVLQLLSANVHFSTTVSNLGVHFDSQLTMQDHVTATYRSCFFPVEAAAGHQKLIDD